MKSRFFLSLFFSLIYLVKTPLNKTVFFSSYFYFFYYMKVKLDPLKSGPQESRKNEKINK